MARYGLVKDGEVVKEQNFSEAPISKVRDGKPMWRPIQTVRADYDPLINTHTVNREIQNFKIVDTWIVEDLPAETVRANMLAHLRAYRDKVALTFNYKGVPIKLSDGARADIAALYFQCLFVTSIPDEQVVAAWQEPGYDTLYITAGDLRADGHLFAQHRQKCFAAADSLDVDNYSTIQGLEAAFDAEMEA